MFWKQVAFNLKGWENALVRYSAGLCFPVFFQPFSLMYDISQCHTSDLPSWVSSDALLESASLSLVNDLPGLAGISQSLKVKYYDVFMMPPFNFFLNFFCFNYLLRDFLLEL